ILKQKRESFKIGIVTLEDLTHWNQKLFKLKKETLNIEKNLYKKSHLAYMTKLLKLSTDNLKFYKQIFPLVHSAVEIGAMDKLDLDIFQLEAMDNYGDYRYIIKKYQYQFPKKKIPYNLPINYLDLD
nr:hypothetical protein [Sulfurimonas sp.]